MITNEHQYKVTKGKIADLQKVLDTLASEQSNLPPLAIEATRKGFLLKIAAMTEELEEYDDLKAGRGEITFASIAELPIALIKKRIKLGLTQKELADKLGIKEQMVQRYESNQYESVGFRRLIDVSEALEIEIPLTSVRKISVSQYPPYSKNSLETGNSMTNMGEVSMQAKSDSIKSSCSVQYNFLNKPKDFVKIWATLSMVK
jgi:HTH-type transcriptional regulator / antitoxin HipB